MQTKFHGILTEENMDIVVSTLSIIDIPEKQKMNLIETMANVVYLYQEYFNSLPTKEKMSAMGLLTMVFDTLLDKDINPLAAQYISRGISAFNNNIFSIGGKEDVSN